MQSGIYHYSNLKWYIACGLYVLSKPLAPWRPMELGSCTSPLLSLPSMLAELRTSLGRCHSFLASLTKTPHLLFRTSMLLDRNRPLNTAVLTDQARDLAGSRLRDQHLAVERWQAPASNRRAFSRKNRKDHQQIRVKLLDIIGFTPY